MESIVSTSRRCPGICLGEVTSTGLPMQPSPRAGLSPETSDHSPRFCAEQVRNTFSLFSGWPSTPGNLGLLIRRLLHIYIQAVYTKLHCMGCSALPML